MYDTYIREGNITGLTVAQLIEELQKCDQGKHVQVAQSCGDQYWWDGVAGVDCTGDVIRIY